MWVTVFVPPFGEHRHRYDARHVLAELAWLADGVENLAEQVLVADRVDVPTREPGPVVGLELVDLACGDPLELRAHGLARLQLAAVDEDRAGLRPPAVVGDVAEQVERPGNGDGGSVRQRPLVAGDVVEDELRDAGVVADDDEHRRGRACGLGLLVGAPAPVVRLVVAVEAVQRTLQLGGKPRLAGDRRALAALSREVVAHPRPQVAIRRKPAPHRVVGDRDARDFHDAAFDRVDQREVRDHPREQRPLGVAGPAQEEGCGGQVVDGADPELRLDRPQTGRPDARLRLAPGDLPPVLARGGLRGGIVLAGRLVAVAVVRLVVEHDDVPPRAQVAAHSADHLRRRLGERAALPTAQHLLGELRHRPGLPQLEGVEVRDGDARLPELGELLGRQHVALAVVVVG